MTLARDATSSGDPVLAENYLQHAEHYNRIIMAFRDQQLAQGGEPMNGQGRQRPFMMHDPMDPGDEFSDEDGDDNDTQPPHPSMRHNEPQPSVDSQRFEGPRGGHDNQNRFRDRSDRPDRPDRSDRHGRGPDQQRGFGPQRQQNAEVSAESASGQGAEGQSRRRERFTPTHEQPEFLRRPVRRPRREAGNGTESNSVAEETEQD